jgi:hypothetical protein
MDTVRLITCRLVNDLLLGRLPYARYPTPFRLADGVHAMVNGPIEINEYKSAGDGSYLHTRGFVAGPGPVGLFLLPVSLAFIAAGNAKRRQQAAAFRFEFGGQVHVTTNGFVLDDERTLAYWTTSDIASMEVVDPGQGVTMMQGQSDRGPVKWLLHTPWAQLIFAVWALREYPRHPQLVDGEWMSDLWLDYARSLGHDPELRTASIR